MTAAKLTHPMRVLYVVFGVAVAVSPFLLDVGPWIRIGGLLLGIPSMVGGLTGW